MLFYFENYIGFNSFEVLAEGICGQVELSLRQIENTKIQVPPREVQEEIILECNAIDKSISEARQTIKDIQKEIEKKVAQPNLKKEPLKNFVEAVIDMIDPNPKKGEVIYIGLENIEKNTGILTGEIHHHYCSIKSNKVKFSLGDTLYGKVRPNLSKVYLADYKGICSTDILVLRPKNCKYVKLLAYCTLNESSKGEAVQRVAGLRMPRTSWEKIENIEVPVYGRVDDLVKEIEVLEVQIATANQAIEDAPAHKPAV